MLESELADARVHRDQANQTLVQAQQAAQKAQNDIVGYSYAEQQLLALIKKLDEQPIPSVDSTP